MGPCSSRRLSKALVSVTLANGNAKATFSMIGILNHPLACHTAFAVCLGESVLAPLPVASTANSHRHDGWRKAGLFEDACRF